MDYSTFLQQISKTNGALRKLVGVFGKSALKDQLAKSMSHLEECKDDPQNFDFTVVLAPYFSTAALDPRHYHSVILDCFITVFGNAPTIVICLSEEIAEKMIQTVFSMYRSDLPDDSQLKFCKIITTALSSVCGRMYVHGKLLQECFAFLLKMNGSAQTSYIQEVTKMTVQGGLRQIIDRYDIGDDFMPQLKSTATMANYYESFAEKEAQAVQEYIPGATEAKIQDVDLIVVITILTESLINRKVPLRTLSLCADCISILLESNSAFLETLHFLKSLKENIHVALLSLALDNSSSLALTTSRLILTVWRKFAAHYVEGLNEVLDRGIATALSSPHPAVILRTLRIIMELAKEPQFMVDCFVNYDCDHSGFFRNIFENSINCVVRHSYPGQENPNVQKTALKTLADVLESLWAYFNEMEAKKEKEEDNAQNFIEAKKAKDKFDQGLQIFKGNPKKGIAFFIENQIVENDPQKIADFLFNTPSLDPAGIGETIGGSGELNLQVLPKFVAHFNFKDLSFEGAFRRFLSKFQIPGEAQMIDRVMEQFGSKFYNDNPDLFSCADTVYVLSFSTLMLHTDAHHPNVTKRMSLDEFVTNNKGIDGGKDLPYSFLENLYKGITSEKINLMASSTPSTSLLTGKQRAELYRQQCTQTLKSARARTLSQGSAEHQFHRAESSMLIGPMYHSVWGGILAAFTTSFQETEDRSIIDICLEGFQLCTHIASHCYVEDALQTMVDSFAKFTRLRIAGATLGEKNFLCTNALIVCAIQDRNFLKGAWNIILDEVSALDRLKDTIKCDMTVTENIFTQTGMLDRESILDFVRAMCETSRKEVVEPFPRTFTLVKFTDVAYWNMDRPMYIWNEIWNIIGKEHLAEQGQSSEVIVASATIDTIRQLARKFLPKPEMTQFHFQKHFLEPFAVIFQKQTNHVIRDLILDCVDSLASELAPVLHSGWCVFLEILTMSATDDDLKERGFSVTEKIIMNMMDSVKPYIIHVMDVLKNFVINDHENIIAQQAVAHFSLLADAINPEETDNWTALFGNAARCAQHEIRSVEQCSEEILVSIVTGHGCMKNEFDDEVWHDFISNVMIDLIPINTRDSERARHGLHVLRSMCDHLLFKFPEAIEKYRGDTLGFLTKCCAAVDEGLRTASLSYLTRFVEVNAEHVRTPELATVLVDSMRKLLPHMLNSVLFVDTVSMFVEFFGETEFTTEMMNLLAELSSERSGREPEPWCRARQCYMRNLIKQGRIEETAAHWKETLAIYAGMETPEKDRMIIVSLELVNAMDDDAFNTVCDADLPMLCKLIETEGCDVRKKLMETLRRKITGK